MNMREELDMLFLLEHFSLEDLVEAENKYEDAIASEDEDYFLDVIMEKNEYQDYLTAKENL